MAKRGQRIAMGVILGALGFGLGAAWLLSPELSRVEPGSRAPDATAVRLDTGDTLAIHEFAGQVVLLNIWATYCGPCEQEMPSIQRLYDELGPEGLQVLAVSIDPDNAVRIRRWLNRRHLTFTSLHDRSGRIQKIYQTVGVPESFVLDREGVIVKKVIGATEWDHPGHKALFRRLLAERASCSGPADC